MKNLVGLLRIKEHLERWLVQTCISTIDLSPPSRRHVSAVLFLTVLALATAVGVISSASRNYSVVYRLVEPGNYRPQVCSEWKFESGTEHQLEEGLEQLGNTAATLNITVMPGNQMGLPFCVIQLGQEQLLNPRVTIFEGQAARYTVNPGGFCSIHSELDVELTPAVTLGWTDPVTKKVHYRRFADKLAQELQVAIKIERGEYICGPV